MEQTGQINQQPKSVHITNPTLAERVNVMGMQTVDLAQADTAKAQSIDAEAIQTWLINYLAQLLDIEPTTIDVNHSFESYGLDSSTSIALTADLEDWLGGELEPTLIYEYQTIETLSQYLS